VELQTRVEQISATAGELRASAADGRKSRQVVDSLFRAVHSFKAAALAASRNDLSRTAHEFENLLHSLRTGKLNLNEEVLRMIDDTVDALRDRSPASSLDRLHELARQTPAGHELLPPEFADLQDDERHRAAAAMREGANLYVMKAVFDVSDFDERFRQLKDRLEKNAELISASASMEDDRVIFRVFYASRSEKIPLHAVFRQVLQAGRSAATTLAKDVSFVVRGEEILLDQRWSDVLTDALLHLVRNAVDHGIESHGTVVLEATTTPDEAVVTVTDDGRGIAPEDVSQIFQPGFSTAKDVTDFSGRGVGLDAVKTAVEELGGSVSVTSEPHKRSSFKITIPNPIS
jgi:two-component system, chemotaxis family, sensor kinase CheA